MGLPTLLVKGSLIQTNEIYKQDYLDSKIPIKHIIDIMKKSLESRAYQDKILFIISKTGSGKSTTLPTALFLEFESSIEKRLIGITQPKTLTAISTPANIAREGWAIQKGIKLGVNIGYKVKIVSERPKRGVLFMTIGILVQQFRHFTDEELMRTYQIVIVDECHEVTQEVELLFSLIKKFMMRNYENPACITVIFTSATFDIDAYSKFFNCPNDNHITVKGDTFPIETRFLTYTSDKITEACVETIKKIHMENTKEDPEKSDILVFMPGKRESTDLFQALIRNKEISRTCYVAILNRESVLFEDFNYRQLNMTLAQVKEILKLPQLTRRIFISTSIAETGITIDSLKYVVDTLWSRTGIYFPYYNAEGLLTIPSSMNSTIQRRGRVGRKQPGIFYPMVTEDTYNSLISATVPEIYSQNNVNTLLSIYCLTPDNIPAYSSIDLLNRMSLDNYKFSNEKLFTLGLLSINLNTDENIYYVTELGKIINKILLDFDEPFRIEYMIVIFSGLVNNYSLIDLIEIIAVNALGGREIALTTNAAGLYTVLRKVLKKEIFDTFFESYEAAKIGYEKLQMFLGDEFIEMFLILKIFILRPKKLMKYLKIVRITAEDLITKFIKFRQNIIENLMLQGINPFCGKSIIHSSNIDTFYSRLKKIKYCLNEGFKLNVFRWNPEANHYVSTRNSMIQITIPPFIKKLSTLTNNGELPVFILTNHSKVKKVKTGAHVLTADKVSIMDGFIDTDVYTIYGN